MTKRILDRIVEESGYPDLLEMLADRLSGADLTSLLLEVYRRRSLAIVPATVLSEYTRSPNVLPSSVSPSSMLALDVLAFEAAAPMFEAIDLSPVCPMGSVSAVGPISQMRTVSGVRGLEVVSDSTNVLALECAKRRLKLKEDVRLCTSHRVLRPSSAVGHGYFSHFRLFSLCSSGRARASYDFEVESLVEMLGVLVRFLSAAMARSGSRVEVRLTDFSAKLGEVLQNRVIGILSAKHGEVEFAIDITRTQGRGYYLPICFSIDVIDRQDRRFNIGDGGFTDWTQKLLSNRKERLLIGAIGTERLAGILDGPI